MPKTVDPKTTVFAPFLNDPRFPSDGTIPDQWKQFQPRGGFAWDIGQTGKTVLRGSAGLYYARQNMLSQVGSVTTNGIQQKSDFRSSGATDMPVWPNLLPPSPVRARHLPALHRDPRLRPRLPESPHRQRQRRLRARADAEHVGVRRLHGGQGHAPDPVPELQRARHGCCAQPAGHSRHDDLHRRQSIRACSSATCS